MVAFFTLCTAYLKICSTQQIYIVTSFNLFIAWVFTIRVRILWFNWQDIKNPDAGGAEVFTHEVMTRLTKMGYEITLFWPLFPNTSFASAQSLTSSLSCVKN